MFFSFHHFVSPPPPQKKPNSKPSQFWKLGKLGQICLEGVLVNVMCHLQQVPAAVQAVLLRGHVIPEGYVDIISRHYFLDAVAGGSEGEAQTCTLDRTGLFSAWYKYDSTHLLIYSCCTCTQRFYGWRSWDLWESGLPHLEPQSETCLPTHRAWRARFCSVPLGPGRAKNKHSLQAAQS